MNTYAGFFIREGAQAQQDIDVIEEVYVTDCYHLSALRSRGGSPLIVDIGAHIGSFARIARKYFPDAQILSVEACAENLPLLCKNTDGEALHAACYYAEEPIALLNSIFEGGTATGGSIVQTLSRLEAEAENPEYRKDLRPLPCRTLEALASGRFIDLLKVDAEGSELNILTGADITRIGTIVGEYHRVFEWEHFRAARFPGWRYTVLDTGGDAGRFRLEGPQATLYCPGEKRA